ncbi:unnamed protein product, partial [Angiostrongylus costaricensis]|uniref:Secreted protein n=1 Tax=Angiostrongylus costaricensis TaxID=334426 RepID=A0A158PLZ3_ANGCS
RPILFPRSRRIYILYHSCIYIYTYIYIIYNINIYTLKFSTSWHFTLFTQIMIEIHGTPFETASLLQFISHQGYWLLFHEINGAFHNLCEFSFIHEAAFSRYGATPMIVLHRNIL